MKGLLHYTMQPVQLTGGLWSEGCCYISRYFLLHNNILESSESWDESKFAEEMGLRQRV